MTPRRVGAGRARPRRSSCAWSRWRWCTASPAHRRSAPRRTCGRRPQAGSAFDLTPTALAPLEPYRDYLTIVSNTDCRNAEAFTRARDRRRSLPLGGGVPDAVASAADAGLGRASPAPRSTRSTRKAAGQDTPIPSMQLCIENIDQSGGCFYGYSCAYTDSISWASPKEPLPMIRDPRAVFDQLFGVGATPEARARRRRKRQEPARLGDDVGGRAEGRRSAPATARGSTTISTTCARSSGASRRSRRTTPAARRASCRRRRSACPTPTPITSS